jgi:nucleolysin TIA-1/TIAR
MPYQQQMQQPGSAGGYGRGAPQQPQWGQSPQAAFNQNGFGGYQG